MDAELRGAASWIINRRWDDVFSKLIGDAQIGKAAGIGRKEIDVLNYCIGVDFKMDGNEEKVTMCKAAQQLEERGED